jgi:hypothetical protein
MNTESHIDLSEHAVDNDGIGKVYYIPNFVTEEEEEYLIRQVPGFPSVSSCQDLQVTEQILKDIQRAETEVENAGKSEVRIYSI